MLDRLTVPTGASAFVPPVLLPFVWSGEIALVKRGRRSVLSGLNHRDDHAGRIEAASDPGLTDLAAALPCIINAHREWGRERAATIP